MNKHQRKSRAPAFEAWLDDFFASYYRRRPVNATFIGVHDYDDCLPDLSADGVGETLAEMRALLDRAGGLPVEPLTRPQAIDKRLAEGFLRIQCWEYEGDHFWRGNPSLYVSEAIFGVLSLFLTDFDDLQTRVAAATARLNQVPALLRQGAKNIVEAPEAWTKQAIGECDGALAFLTGGATEAAGNAATKDYGKAVVRAAAAFADFKQHLGTGLKPAPDARYSVGPEALSLHLRDAHCLDQDADEIVRYAEDQLAEAKAYLTQHAADFGAADPGEALPKLREIHPAAENYYARYQEIWDEVCELALDQQLLTWPDFPIRYVPRPVWAREAAPHLYFLFYRAPAAFNRPPVHDYLVAPIDASMPAERQLELLRANNDSVIRLNHVVHHGGIGHHVQNWHAYRAESRVGRIAAVDCASRIAMNCGGTMAEGWACYATDLIAEMGALTELEYNAEKQTRTRMCARAIVDIRLHQGRFSLEEAVEFYQRQVGMSAGAAHAEATRNSMYPGAAVMYLTGTDAIHALRARLQKTLGERFNLREFHDKFLSYGSIPVALIAEVMLEEAGAKAEETAI